MKLNFLKHMHVSVEHYIYTSHRMAPRARVKEMSSINILAHCYNVVVSKQRVLITVRLIQNCALNGNAH